MKQFLIQTTLTALLVGVCNLQAVAQQWNVSFSRNKKGSHLVVESSNMYVTFRERAAWTIAEIRYQDRMIGQPSGATGAVFQWVWYDPTLTARDFRWNTFASALVQGRGKENSLHSQLWAKLSAEEKEALMQLAENPEADVAVAVESFIQTVNDSIREPEFFKKAYLEQIKAHPEKVYARRMYKRLQAKRTGNEVDAQTVARLNRYLLEYYYTDKISNQQQAMGTGHGHEQVKSIQLTVDGKTHELIADGRLAVNRGSFTANGEKVTLKKVSVIGPWDHEAVFEFPVNDASFLAAQDFVANEGMANGTFAGYTYTYMFMMPTDYTDFLVLSGDGTEKPLQVDETLKKAQRLITAPWKTLIAYSPQERIGIVYAYPETSTGKNHILARTGKDKKWRAILEKREEWNPGDEVRQRLKVVPYEATPDTWKQKGKDIEKGLSF